MSLRQILRLSRLEAEKAEKEKIIALNTPKAAKKEKEDGVEKAKTNLELLKSAGEKNIDSIKKEAELSLEELDKMPTNSKQEMDEFVKNYNLGL